MDELNVAGFNALTLLIIIQHLISWYCVETTCFIIFIINTYSETNHNYKHSKLFTKPSSSVYQELSDKHHMQCSGCSVWNLQAWLQIPKLPTCVLCGKWTLTSQQPSVDRWHSWNDLVSWVENTGQRLKHLRWANGCVSKTNSLCWDEIQVFQVPHKTLLRNRDNRRLIMIVK